MGFFSSLTSSGRQTTGQPNPHDSAGHGHGKKRHAPATAEELASLISSMRAAIVDADLVDRQLTNGGEEGLTDAQLKRWLAARSWDPVRAAHDLAAHAAWREKFVPHGRVLESEIPEQIAQQKVLLQGLDHHGRPVAILVGGNHIPRPDHTEVQRFYCYASDACIALADPERNPEGRVVFIIDVGDFGWKNFDLLGAKTLFGMMHAHYVERLSTVYLHNAGTILMQLFKLVSPFIDPVTREKLVFLPHDPQEAAAILAKDVDISLLPPNLGGSSAPRPVEQVWSMLLEEAAARTSESDTAGDSASERGGSSLGAAYSDDAVVDIGIAGPIAAKVAAAAADTARDVGHAADAAAPVAARVMA